MAGPYIHHSSCRNFSPAGEDKLASAAPNEGSGTPTRTPIVLRVSFPALTATPTATLSLDNELFKQFIKAYLEAQVPTQTEIDPEPRKQHLKAWFSDLYYGNELLSILPAMQRLFWDCRGQRAKQNSICSFVFAWVCHAAIAPTQLTL